MARGFLRVRIIVNTRNPLITGCWLLRKDDKDTWVEFRYERLQDFCYRCGRIGHVMMNAHLNRQKEVRLDLRNGIRRLISIRYWKTLDH